jgi:hypothetical protein
MRGCEWQPLEHIAQIGVGIMTIEPRTLRQTHHDGGAASCASGACKEPVVATERDGADAVLDPVVVDRQRAVIEITRQR